MTKLIQASSLVKRAARISDRLRRNGGRPVDRQVVFLTYESSLRDAANRSRSGEERAYSRAMAAALHGLLHETWPLFANRLKQRAQQKRAPVVQVIMRRAAPRARRSARRSLSARAGPSADSDAGGGGDPALAALGRLQRTQAWTKLLRVDRSAIVRLLANDEPGAVTERIDSIFVESALLRNEHPGTGPLWLGGAIPRNALLVKESDGLWRVLEFAADSTAPIVGWRVRGRA